MELLLALAFILVIVATVAIIPSDGHGHTPEERSLQDWSDGALPSRPFSQLMRW
ncbi:hypothetical protein [Arthrobacter crystallopoietes]|jgi:hypothetical protein|uniref:hypothetical protein n=1 Tax=Crystallibacter crystallopoietes TaxID=37928 RepID=UPI001487612F|nr:hypothetical protein [Arthrobacter crystallopoietes]QTG80573.1 hypothetical protein J5251_17360 [Arthrobacter crystallopoietes]